MQKMVCIALLCLLWQGSRGQLVYDRWFRSFEMLRMEDGSMLQVNSLCCAPCFYDLQGKGEAELIVGEFGRVPVPAVLQTISKTLVQGRFRVYPKGEKGYRGYTWLGPPEQPIYVPITCCVSSSPTFADLDGDGVDELFSGSYLGQLYRWKRDGIEFGEAEQLSYPDGTPIRIGNATTLFLADMDGDGLIDLLITGLYDGVFIAKNSGTLDAYRFEKAAPVLVGEVLRPVKANHAVAYDWDGDGWVDIVYGADYGGNVSWCRNLGDGRWAEPEILVENRAENGVLFGKEPVLPGGKPKLCFFDYDGDGKEDLIIGTESWFQSPPLTEENFRTALQAESLREIREEQKKLEKKIRRHVNPLPMDDVSMKAAPVPEKLKEEWLRLSGTYNRQLFKEINRIAGVEKESEAFSTIWVFYRK